MIKKLFLLSLLSLLFISCSDSIKSECEVDIEIEDRMGATFTEIQEKVLTPSCATGGCHGGNFFNHPRLTADVAYENLINVNSIQNPDMPYVDPGNSANSWIMFKILGQGTSVMPPPPNAKLNQSVIDSIAAWIDAGAPNN